jgi:uncharacterized protein with HEPN domain
MVRKDEALLLDMLLACQKIQDFTKNLSEDDFKNNALVQSAVIREFQVLGEAARMMSDAGKETYKNIPWEKIAGMRNKLIHEYFDIRLNVVWETIRDDIPSLITQLEAVVLADEGDDEN